MFKKLFQKKPAVQHTVIVNDSVTLSTGKKQTILDAALDQGINYPYNCGVGGCGECKCQLLEGEVHQRTDASYLLTAEEIEQGYILGCQSVPTSDIRIAVAEMMDDEEALPSYTVSGILSSIQALNHDILELTITLDETIRYRAGQYANISIDGGPAMRSYSFANRPAQNLESNEVQFHIRHVPGGAFTDWLMQNHSQLQGSKVQVVGPLGHFYLRPSSAPLLCIAGGSGFAPIKAILEDMMLHKTIRGVALLYGARQQTDLYAEKTIDQIRRSWLASFEYIPVLSSEPEGSDWHGQRGFVHDQLQNLSKDWPAHHVYMCGPPPMIDAATAVLLDLGVDAANIHADKFLDQSHLQAQSSSVDG